MSMEHWWMMLTGENQST